MTGPLHAMTDEEKDYTGFITVTMPGETKKSTYRINVRTFSKAAAMDRIEEEWKRATEPRDVRITEISPVVTGS